MAVPLITEMPDPQYVMSSDGFRLATYSFGDPDAPTVLAVHGFASSCRDNWAATGWVRELTRAGFRVLGVDQRGHGLSEKPHEPDDFSMDHLVADLETILDQHLVEDFHYLGYSLGARVGWHTAVALPHRLNRAVLGGIPDGKPLGRIDLAQAHAYLEHGTEVTDRDTINYVKLADRVPGNELRSLIALAEGMRFDADDPDLGNPPPQPILFATGSKDTILEQSRRLAEGAPDGWFFEIPGRNHFNAPGSRDFRDAGVEFFGVA
ncbi:alpha/beta fold hydrolase [Microbacterium halophytorum]|uniref:alpha/beta fold hydrolase n=1 Tax=Microbacterium halophytorum TaxID=2067568 RepID=UPI000CFC0332|nr:alpha/beta hydrolase [Microbacterium halophytorum]